jgi:hypothetical protein
LEELPAEGRIELAGKGAMLWQERGNELAGKGLELAG